MHGLRVAVVDGLIADQEGRHPQHSVEAWRRSVSGAYLREGVGQSRGVDPLLRDPSGGTRGSPVTDCHGWRWHAGRFRWYGRRPVRCPISRHVD